jgi:hypothetical protein
MNGWMEVPNRDQENMTVGNEKKKEGLNKNHK